MASCGCVAPLRSPAEEPAPPTHTHTHTHTAASLDESVRSPAFSAHPDLLSAASAHGRSREENNAMLRSVHTNTLYPIPCDVQCTETAACHASLGYGLRGATSLEAPPEIRQRAEVPRSGPSPSAPRRFARAGDAAALLKLLVFCNKHCAGRFSSPDSMLVLCRSRRRSWARRT